MKISNKTLGVILVAFVVLDTFMLLWLTGILPLNKYLPFLSRMSGTPSKSFGTQPLSLTRLTPVPSGNYFQQPVIPSGSPYGIIVITGHIADIAQNKGRTFLSIIKSDGTPVKDVAPLIPHVGITIATTQNNKNYEKQGSVHDLMKGDLVMVSYNIDPKTRQVVISGVRIMR